MTELDEAHPGHPRVSGTRRNHPYPPADEGFGYIVRRALLTEPMRNARPGYMRELNLLIVLDAFRSHGQMSRAAVARVTGLSAPTVSKSVQQLVDAGLVVEDGFDEGNIGKPATRVRFNANCGAALGIDLGGTHLRVAVSDLAGQVIDRSLNPIDASEGPETLIGRIVREATALLSKTGARLTAVGMATPGIVDVNEGVVVRARNLRGWDHVPVRQALEDAFGVPAVVENDVNAAAMGERWHGAARGHDSYLFVAIGTGIGAGIVVGGELYRGVHFAAGEINLLRMGDADDAYLEDRASGPAIVRRALELGHPPSEGITTTEDVFAAAAGGDQPASQAVDEGVHAIAHGCAVLVATIDPSLVVIGGGVSSQGSVILNPLRQAIGEAVRLRCDVVLSELGVDAQLHGALFVALKRADLALVDRLSTRANA